MVTKTTSGRTPNVLVRLCGPVLLVMILGACMSFADEQPTNPSAQPQAGEPDGFVKPASKALPLASDGLKPGLAVLYFE